MLLKKMTSKKRCINKVGSRKLCLRGHASKKKIKLAYKKSLKKRQFGGANKIYRNSVPVKRIVLYALSANPPTLAHEDIIRQLSSRYDAVFVWASSNWLKLDPSKPEYYDPLYKSEVTRSELLNKVLTGITNVKVDYTQGIEAKYNHANTGISVKKFIDANLSENTPIQQDDITFKQFNLKTQTPHNDSGFLIECGILPTDNVELWVCFGLDVVRDTPTWGPNNVFLTCATGIVMINRVGEGGKERAGPGLFSIAKKTPYAICQHESKLISYYDRLAIISDIQLQRIIENRVLIGIQKYQKALDEGMNEEDASELQAKYNHVVLTNHARTIQYSNGAEGGYVILDESNKPQSPKFIIIRNPSTLYLKMPFFDWFPYSNNSNRRNIDVSSEKFNTDFNEITRHPILSKLFSDLAAEGDLKLRHTFDDARLDKYLVPIEISEIKIGAQFSKASSTKVRNLAVQGELGGKKESGADSILMHLVNGRIKDDIYRIYGNPTIQEKIAILEKSFIAKKMSVPEIKSTMSEITRLEQTDSEVLKIMKDDELNTLLGK